jgi:hypothetical protein
MNVSADAAHLSLVLFFVVVVFFRCRWVCDELVCVRDMQAFVAMAVRFP